MTAPSPGGMVPEYLSDRSLSHTQMLRLMTSVSRGMRQRTILYCIMRNMRNLLEISLNEAAAINSLTYSSTVTKLFATASTKRRCIFVWVSFFCSWLGLAGAAEDTPLRWPRPAEARPGVEHPPPLAGARFERFVADGSTGATPREGICCRTGACCTPT